LFEKLFNCVIRLGVAVVFQLYAIHIWVWERLEIYFKFFLAVLWF